jgi:hypothetical protein
MLMSAPATFKTRELNLAAYLVTVGHELLSIESQPDDWRRVFVFDAVAEALKADYYRGGNVPAVLYGTNLLELKRKLAVLDGRIRSTKNSTEVLPS